MTTSMKFVSFEKSDLGPDNLFVYGVSVIKKSSRGTGAESENLIRKILVAATSHNEAESLAKPNLASDEKIYSPDTTRYYKDASVGYLLPKGVTTPQVLKIKARR